MAANCASFAPIQFSFMMSDCFDPKTPESRTQRPRRHCTVVLIALNCNVAFEFVVQVGHADCRPGRLRLLRPARFVAIASRPLQELTVFTDITKMPRPQTECVQRRTFWMLLCPKSPRSSEWSNLECTLLSSASTQKVARTVRTAGLRTKARLSADR